MVRKVLIFGHRGMLGHVAETYFKERGYDVTTSGRNSGDIPFNPITDINKGMSFIKRFDVIINGIGMLKDACKKDPASAIIVNGLFPQVILNNMSEGSFFFHISTDCVYDGAKGNYDSFDTPDAKDFYGYSKALGEIPHHCCFRTSIIGPELKVNGSGLMNQYLQGNIKNGWSNHYWNGVTTLELVSIMEFLTEHYYQIGSYFGGSGTITQLTQNEHISKYELLNKIKTYIGGGDIGLEQAKDGIDRTLIPNHAYPIKSYDRQLAELKNWIINHPELYDIIYPKVYSDYFMKN